ncbi:MAG: radical SAM protein [Rhodothermales bacterium]|nr:radical SAM protein [Rhodothermales bacterium]
MNPLDTASIRRLRGPKASLDPARPYAISVEAERTAAGTVEDVLTVFLTNRECPYTCLMCDLWTHTLDHSVEPGQVLEQVDYAIASTPGVRHIKLYNAGNFLDRRAIPASDRDALAGRLAGFDSVIIENHPRMCSEDLRAFQDGLSGELEVAMGLETVHPEVLPRLNKQMTLDDFALAAERLQDWGIHARAFVLLGLPWTPAGEFGKWAERSVAFARGAGCRVVAVIPTRAGNGAMDHLAATGAFQEPTLRQLEDVQEALLPGPGRTFVDLWDAERFASCDTCRDARIERMGAINHGQTVLPTVACLECHAG